MDGEYLAQLSAEKAIRKYVKGRGAVREWVKLRERNEALDLEVYALAALYILGQKFLRSLPERAARFARAVEAPAEVKPDMPQPPRWPAHFQSRRRGWITGMLE